MTTLARALGADNKKSLVRIEPFHSDSTQNLITWLEEFERATKANCQSAARQLELALAYLKDNTQKWYQSLAHVLTHFKSNEHGNEVDGNIVYSFYHMFRERFCTLKQKATQQQQLFAIQQGTDTVDTYVNRFKQLKE